VNKIRKKMCNPFTENNVAISMHNIVIGHGVQKLMMPQSFRIGK